MEITVIFRDPWESFSVGKTAASFSAACFDRLQRSRGHNPCGTQKLHLLAPLLGHPPGQWTTETCLGKPVLK